MVETIEDTNDMKLGHKKRASWKRLELLILYNICILL
jgi:hypothetical protein